MKLGMIWERYLFKETFKMFTLCLGCFFFLYALVDYSFHMQDFIVGKELQFIHILTYYVAQFVKRSDLLIPLALLLSTLKVLFAMNLKGELVALQASGISARRLLRPLFILGGCCTLFNLASVEFFLPSSLNRLDKFRKEHFKHKRVHDPKEPIHVLTLKDRSKILYQEEDAEHQLYRDVFWVRSADDLWHMHSLSTDLLNKPMGYYVDHLQRNKEGQFEKVESFNHYAFTKIRLEEDLTGKGSIPLENRSLHELARMSLHKETLTAYEHPQAQTHLLFKLTMPFLSLLVIVAGAPFCFRYNRNLPLFLTYAGALFGFVSFFAFMDAAVILGENLTLSPYMAILVPFALCSLGFGIYYRKTLQRQCT